MSMTEHIEWWLTVITADTFQKHQHVFTCWTAEGNETRPLCIHDALIETMIMPLAGKDYPIQASTRDEMLVWISAIEEAKVSVWFI